MRLVKKKSERIPTGELRYGWDYKDETYIQQVEYVEPKAFAESVRRHPLRALRLAPHLLTNGHLLTSSPRQAEGIP